MKFQAKAFFILWLAAALPSPATAQGGPEPDRDRDGVSDYDDYCPSTPFGRPVWTPASVAAVNGNPRWIGCAGGAIEQAQPGYVPPPRPPYESALFQRFRGLFQEAGGFDFVANSGGYSGRCAEPLTEEPLNGVLFLAAEPSDAGPAFPDEARFFTLSAPTRAPDYWDTATLPKWKAVIDDVDELRDRLNVIQPVQVGFRELFRDGAGGYDIRRSADRGFLVTARFDGRGVINRYCYFFQPAFSVADTLHPDVFPGTYLVEGSNFAGGQLHISAVTPDKFFLDAYDYRNNGGDNPIRIEMVQTDVGPDYQTFAGVTVVTDVDYGCQYENRIEITFTPTEITGVHETADTIYSDCRPMGVSRNPFAGHFVEAGP